MSAPKMLLNNVEINQPRYGYSTDIYTGLQWNYVGNNFEAYDNGAYYVITRLSDLILTDEQQYNLNIQYCKDVNLELDAVNSGFYPFSPLYNDVSYNVRVLDHNWSGVLKSPWRHISNDLELLYKPSSKPESVIDYTTSPIEGNVFFYDHENSKILDNIREIDQPPTLTPNKKHNSVISQHGTPYTILTSRTNDNAGLTSDIEISGSTAKIYCLLRFLLDIGSYPFYIGDNYNPVYDDPIVPTMEPDYFIFGKKIPMTIIHHGATYFYAWKVKHISNPIVVTHNYLNNFSVKLKLALVS